MLKVILSIIGIVMCGNSHSIANDNDTVQLLVTTQPGQTRYHTYQLRDDVCTLRCPKTREEFEAYHRIRQQEIVTRYCPKDYKYDYNNPEEKMDTNFPFILIDNSSLQVIGVVRVDLLKGEESSIRWVAITSGSQGKSYGTIMLTLVEKFVHSQDRQLIRVPAEEASRAFYQKVGFIPMDWLDAPQNDGNVFLGKVITG